MSRVPVVLGADGCYLGAGCACRVGASDGGEGLVDLMLAILLRGGDIGLVVLARCAIRRSAHRVVEGCHVLHLRVLEADKGCLLAYLVVLVESTVRAARVDGSLVGVAHGAVREHEVPSVERAILELLLEENLLVQHAEHLLVEVVADVLVVHIHLHLFHLVVGGELRLLGAVLHLPHLRQLVAQSYLVLLDLVLQIANMLIVLRVLVIRGILALGAWLEVAHGGDLLLLRLLHELVLRVITCEGFNQVVGCVTAGQLGASETAHLAHHRVRCLLAILLLIRLIHRLLELESRRSSSVLETSGTDL